MKRLILALVLLIANAASAQQQVPSCWVVSGATGYVVGSTDDGRYAAWYCPTDWGWDQVLLVSRTDYVLKHPALPASASAVETAVAYWNANVSFSCAAPNRDAPALLRLCDAAYNAALDTRPLSRWIVAPYSGATYRATYSTSKAIDGVRNATSNGKVLIVTDGKPTPVNCLLGRVVETSSTGAKTTYCSVGGVATTVAASRKR